MKSYLQLAEAVTNLLDNKFRIFGFRFGIDPLLGVIPWLGDLVSALLSCYLIWVAYRMKVPQTVIHKMLRNILFDFVVGSIPVVGDMIDFVYKANTKNLALLKQHVSKYEEGEVITAD